MRSPRARPRRSTESIASRRDESTSTSTATDEMKHENEPLNVFQLLATADCSICRCDFPDCLIILLSYCSMTLQQPFFSPAIPESSNEILGKGSSREWVRRMTSFFRVFGNFERKQSRTDSSTKLLDIHSHPQVANQTITRTCITHTTFIATSLTTKTDHDSFKFHCISFVVVSWTISSGLRCCSGRLFRVLQQHTTNLAHNIDSKRTANNNAVRRTSEVLEGETPKG